MSHAMNPPADVNVTYMAQRPDYQCASISAKQIIEGINHAVTRAQRFQALQTAFRAFHHHNEEMHNYEIDLGAANALCLKLGYILLQKNAKDDVYMEIELVCAALRMVYRCSLDRRVHSFRDIGYTDLLPLLVQVLHVTNAELRPGSQSHAILQTLNVLRVFSKLPSAKRYLIHTQSLWSSLIQLVWSYESIGEQKIPEKDAEAIQLEVMGVMKDLTFRTTDEDKKVVYDVKGFVPTLLHFCRKTPVQRLRECVSSIWWNLAMSPNVGHDMTNNAEVLTSLQSLMSPADSFKTKRNAISSLGNLATVGDNHERLLLHEDGILIQRLMVSAQDEDTDSRRRAMRTLRCLSSGNAAGPLRREHDFCDFLAKVSQNDVDRDTRVQALECMTHIATDGEAMTEVGPGVTTAVIGTIESSNESRLTVEACRTLSLCLSKSEATMESLTSSFYAKLASAITGSTDVESHWVVAVVVSQLGEKDAFSGKIPTHTLLNLLATLVSQVGPDFEQSRTIAMSVIKALSDVDGNKRVLAEDETLLTALVNFAMAAVEVDKKNEAKALILELVPEL